MLNKGCDLEGLAMRSSEAATGIRTTTRACSISTGIGTATAIPTCLSVDPSNHSLDVGVPTKGYLLVDSIPQVTAKARRKAKPKTVTGPNGAVTESGYKILHVISISGGKDSQATALIALKRVDKSSLKFIFCDTGNEHEDVYAHLVYLESKLDITITRLKADFSEQIARKRKFIARDVRTRREYERVPKTDKNGNPVYLINDDGSYKLTPIYRVGTDGEPEAEPIRYEPVRVTGWNAGKKVRWTNKAKRRALEHLYPTGNPFLDLCMWKGRFPSRKAQFCTEELKTAMAVNFQMSLMDQGYGVVSWQGVRRDESEARKNAKLFERVGKRLWIFRPIYKNTAQQVVDYCIGMGTKVCALYSKGFKRVGCMLCINSGKDEIKQAAVRCGEHIIRLSQWELKVALCSKRGLATFFPAPKMTNREAAKQNIWVKVQWAKTTRGGKQYDLLGEVDESTNACTSSYGLCDSVAA